MTLDQLAAFVAVAERQHLTKAAAALNLSPSAVSAAIKTLETVHAIALFHRVGRGVELNSAGRRFLVEAKEMLAKARGAKLLLNELAGVEHGAIELQASQTIANYWLPQRIMRFRLQHPDVEIRLKIGNTTTVTEAVFAGSTELGFVEGEIDEPALASNSVASDRLLIVTSAKRGVAYPRVDEGADTMRADSLMALSWVMRETGSGTRAVFEAGLRAHGLDPRKLNLALSLPSNEAVLTAVRSSTLATALSEAVVAPLLESGDIRALPISLNLRNFTLVRHKERRLSAVATCFKDFCSSS
jgi:DNA-binding transcriptional LysR family regulator